METRPIARTLYLCYFGLREPLVQTQVLPYLRELVRAGIHVSLLTFEPEQRHTWTPEVAEKWHDELRESGIRWLAMPYHKRPSLPATVYDIVVGACVAAHLVRREHIDVLHGRAHVGAAMGALAKQISGARLIFDIRGFNAEEYVDAGRWRPGGLKFRLTKRAEGAILAVGDGFVVLTERAKEILFPGGRDVDAGGRPVEVIPCCVDLHRFQVATVQNREEIRRELGLEGRQVFVYLGALGGWYMTKELAELMSLAVQQDASTFVLILTQSSPELISREFSKIGLDTENYLIRSVAPDEVPRYLQAADVALSLIKPCFSKLSSSPTKLAEYLACGLPILTTSGIGDVDSIVQGNRVGVLLRGYVREDYIAALDELRELRADPLLNERCRSVAYQEFALESVGGPRYRRLYQRILGYEE